MANRRMKLTENLCVAVLNRDRLYQRFDKSYPERTRSYKDLFLRGYALFSNFQKGYVLENLRDLRQLGFQVVVRGDAYAINGRFLRKFSAVFVRREDMANPWYIHPDTYMDGDFSFNSKNRSILF